MDNQMILINSIKVDELIEQLKLFNSNLEKMNFNKQEEIFYTRKEAKEHYNMSDRETAKIFTKLLKNKIVNIGKEQRLAKCHIDELFIRGVVSK